MALYDEIRDALRAMGSPYRPFTEGTIAFPTHDAPEPDVFVTDDVKGDGYVDGTSVPLVIEVADTTLANDIGPKARLYSRLGVPEYWLADLTSRVLLQFAQPGPQAYGQRHAIAFGANVASTAIGGLKITVPLIG